MSEMSVPVRAGDRCRKSPSPSEPVIDVGNVRHHRKTACPLHSTVCVTTLSMPEMSVTDRAGDRCRKCLSPSEPVIDVGNVRHQARQAVRCALFAFGIVLQAISGRLVSACDGDGCRKSPSPIRAGDECRKCPSPTQPVMDVGNVRHHRKTACPLPSTVCVTTLWMSEMSVTLALIAYYSTFFPLQCCLSLHEISESCILLN